jgi:hypothetical protein
MNAAAAATNTTYTHKNNGIQMDLYLIKLTSYSSSIN